MTKFYDKDSCCLIFDNKGQIIGVELDKKGVKGLRKIHTFSTVGEPATLFMEVEVDGFSTKEIDINTKPVVKYQND